MSYLPISVWFSELFTGDVPCYSKANTVTTIQAVPTELFSVPGGTIFTQPELTSPLSHNFGAKSIIFKWLLSQGLS